MTAVAAADASVAIQIRIAVDVVVIADSAERCYSDKGRGQGFRASRHQPYRVGRTPALYSRIQSRTPQFHKE